MPFLPHVETRLLLVQAYAVRQHPTPNLAALAFSRHARIQTQRPTPWRSQPASFFRPTPLSRNKALILHEVTKGNWNWQDYLKHAAKMQLDHKQYIREFCGGSPKTVCVNDISIIALAKTLKLPVLSMEKPVDKSSKKRHIPDICAAEGVTHISFNDFCRKEGFQF